MNEIIVNGEVFVKKEPESDWSPDIFGNKK